MTMTTLSFNIFQLLCHLISLSSANNLAPGQAIPAQPALVSGILSGPSAATYGPIKLRPRSYTLLVEWITPGSSRTTVALVSTTSTSRGPENYNIWGLERYIPRAFRRFGDDFPRSRQYHLGLSLSERRMSSDGTKEFMVILGDDMVFADPYLPEARLLSKPTTAEVRFWIFDCREKLNLEHPVLTFYAALGGTADDARRIMQLPSSTGGDEARTGADVLVAAGLARVMGQ